MADETIPLERVSIVRAFRPGDVVFIEVDRVMRVEEQRSIAEILRAATESTGVKVIVLAHGMRIAGREETLEAQQ